MKHFLGKLLSLALCAALLLSLCPSGLAESAEKGELWLTDKKITLSLWYDFTQEQLGNMADPNEADIFQWL